MGCLLKQGGGLYPRLRIGAVLLAAGAGRRMGGAAKPLIRLQGVPLIKRQLVALSGAGVDEVAVVTGHAHGAVESLIDGFPVTIVRNASFAAGQQGSVRAGLDGLTGPFDAVLVVPCDLPLLAADDLIELIGAFKKRPRGHVVVPVVNGERGNPIVLDEHALEEIRTSGTNLACRHLIDSRPDLVHRHETSNARFVTDIDTLEDVRALAERTGWRLEVPSIDTSATNSAAPIATTLGADRSADPVTHGRSHR